ncbi:MAG: hypothetical protein P4M00_14005 [Azospirillaceae bacterium]|nr:hypothetical protein [Azospirillaceae bacterium]
MTDSRQKAIADVEALVTGGHYNEAKGALFGLLYNFPHWPEPHVLEGRLLLLLDSPKEAAGAFQRGLQVDPTRDQTDPYLCLARGHLGILAAEDGRTQQALADLEVAAAFLPRWADLYAALGAGYFRVGDAARALAAMSQVATLNPFSWEAAYNVAMLRTVVAGQDETVVAADFVLPVWGEAYVDMALDAMLPTLLHDGNLNALPASRLRIFTRPEDADTIRRWSRFSTLAALTEVEFVDLPLAGMGSKYDLMTRCHLQGMIDGLARRAVVFFPMPDNIYSAGLMAAAYARICAGAKAVMIATLQVSNVDAWTAWQARSKPADSRSLVEIALAHASSWSRQCFWGQEYLAGWPSHLSWPVGQRGRCGHFFHLHPIAVVPPRALLTRVDTIDGELVGCFDPETEIDVIQDSDDGVAISLDQGENWAIVAGDAESQVAAVSEWARIHANRAHRAFFRQSIRIHADDIGAAWQAEEVKAQAVVDAILAAAD